MTRYAFGVDIGGTSIKIGLFSENGELLKKWEIPTRREERGSQILPDLARELERECAARQISLSELAGVGVGVPGPVLEERIVNRCVNLGWGVEDVADRLQALTGVETVKIINDANAAALGETWRGVGRGVRDAVLVTLGTGVGAGVILNGKPVPSAFGASGEIGHMCFDPDETALCSCGKAGHLEQYVSAPGIVRAARRQLESGRPSSLRSRGSLLGLTAKDVFDAAQNGDELALEVTDRAAKMLARALAAVSCVVDPKLFILGGGVSAAGRFLLDNVASHFARYVFHASAGAGFALAELGNDAGIYGAVKLVIDE